jgi:hypothetical protein
MDNLRQRTFTGLVYLTIAALLFAGQVQPAYSTPLEGTLTVTPTSAAPGEKILVNGSIPGFGPTDYVSVWLDYVYDGRLLGSTQLREDGSFSLAAILPPDADPGTHPIIAEVNKVPEMAETTIQVTEPKYSALFIYGEDLATAQEFEMLLDDHGIRTTLVKVADLGGINLTQFNVILAGPDSGYRDVWGTILDIRRLNRSYKPVLGIGEGGYALFGKLGQEIGYPHGWHRDQQSLFMVDPRNPIFNSPYPIPSGDTLQVYTLPTDTISINLQKPSERVATLGREVDDLYHYNLVGERGRYLFWGFGGGPELMTYYGKQLFINAVLAAIQAASIDTLILTDYDRMEGTGYAHADVVGLQNDISSLVGHPKSRTNMVALQRDLFASAPASLSTLRSTWDANENSVTNNNTYVYGIDAYIEHLKQSSYPNLLYVIFVGASDQIPMLARPADDMDTHKESNWASTLPQTSGYFYSIYHDTSNYPYYGHYFTDTMYGDLSYLSNGYGVDDVLIPELAVGRLVETPVQISTLVQNYIASYATFQRTNTAAIGSNDYKDGAQQAANHMGASADTSLIQTTFDSTLIPPVVNNHRDVIYIGGHGNYNKASTGSGGFMAGSSTVQGDTEELVNLPNAIVVTSGCHNGVNFGNQLYHDYTGDTTYGEFPERFANKQVGVYLGSTGYTWISGSGSSSNPDYTGWSEKLATHFLKHLLNDGMWTTAGKAYKAAVNEYVSDYGGVDNPHRRVLAIATLYGIPNYHPPRLIYKLLHDFGYWLQREWLLWPVFNAQSLNAAALVAEPAEEALTFHITDWDIGPDGLVTIPGASLTGDFDEPILPLVSAGHILPPGSVFIEMALDEEASESITIDNDVPLASMKVQEEAVPNPFAYDGFYSPDLIQDVTQTSLGGAGTSLDLVIKPVQYNPTTHQTRIWTRLAFKIIYEVDPEALYLDADEDGLPDYWETGYGLDPVDGTGDQGGSGDPDQDGLDNTTELELGTDPLHHDTDRDGVTDGEEVEAGTDPSNPGSTVHPIYLPSIRSD